MTNSNTNRGAGWRHRWPHSPAASGPPETGTRRRGRWTGPEAPGGLVWVGRHQSQPAAVWFSTPGLLVQTLYRNAIFSQRHQNISQPNKMCNICAGRKCVTIIKHYFDIINENHRHCFVHVESGLTSSSGESVIWLLAKEPLSLPEWNTYTLQCFKLFIYERNNCWQYYISQSQL